MFRSHYNNANNKVTPSKTLLTETKQRMQEQVSDLEFDSPSEIPEPPSRKEIHIMARLSRHRSSSFKKHILIVCSIVICTGIVAAATLITRNFINQTGKPSSESTVIIANKTPESGDPIDSTLWYGNYSGNGDSSLLTITKNDAASFKFSLSVTVGEMSDSLTGTASITAYNTAKFEQIDGFILYFTLSNGVVSLTKDPSRPDKHTVSFTGDYINTDGNIDCYKSNYFTTMRSFGKDTVYQFDLNHDGNLDRISYKSGILTINKQTYNFTEESANLDLDTFHIVDINTADDYLNVLVMDDGPSCDPVTTVVTYTKTGKIATSSLGCNVEQLKFNNKGTISGYFRFDILQTWYGECTWEYLNNEITFITQDYYNPVDLYSTDSGPIASNQKILLYKSDRLRSEKIVLRPQKVKFVKTDNIHWVEVVGLKDNTDGWLYLDDYNEVPDENTSAEEIFDNLILAD